MSADIAAIEALFPKPTLSGPGAPGVAASTGNGPYPFDAIKTNGGHLDPQLAAAIETVRADPNWGVVYHGDLTKYGGNHSAADLALCGKFARLGLPAPLIDTALRSSGLFRPKWERADYRASTIGKALDIDTGFIPPQSPLSLSSPDLALSTPAATNSASAGQVQPLPVLAECRGRIDAGTVPPPPRLWLIEGALSLGKSAIVAGLSGVSKTQAVLLLGVSVAAGIDFAGRKTRIGKVMFVSGEEDGPELQRRINAIIRHAMFPPNVINDVRQNLRAYPAVGRDIRLTIKSTSGLVEGPFGSELVNAARALGDVRLIVLDHAGLVHGGDFSAKEDAALTMRIVNDISVRTGAAVVLLAHSPKGAMKAEEVDASMVFGSSAFVEQSRGGWILATMTKDKARLFGVAEADRREYVALTGVKANYTRDGQEFWFRRVSFDEVGVLEHVTLTPPIKQGKSLITLTGNVLQTVLGSPGRYPKTKLRDEFQGKKAGPWQASKAEIESCIDDLLQQGKLVNRSPTADERKRYNHRGQVTAVLDVPTNAGSLT